MELLLLLLSCFVCHAESNFSVTDNAQQQQQLSVLFTRSVYRGTIREHFPFKNESIRQLVTIVPPIRVQRVPESSSVVRYSILGGDDDGFFRIDALSGELFLVREIDREQLPPSAVGDRFSLVIQASVAVDVEPSRARVVIDVEDVNDNPPTFDQNDHVISIVENLPIAFHVLQLSAVDPDLGDNGKFSYQLIDSSGAFGIDPITGWLSVINSTPLDRERVDRLKLKVQAVEERPNLLTNMSQSFTQIDIELTDSNDNSPVFQPTNLYSFTVEDLAGPGTVIGQVRAVDADADVNGLVNYAIQHQQESARTGRARKTGPTDRPNNLTALLTTSADAAVPFSIHPRSGHLIVTDTPLTMKSYTLIVEASDQPFNPSERRHSLAVVQISVLSPTLVVPQFVNIPYEFWVGGSAPVDTSVGQVRAEGFLEPEDVRYTMKYRRTVPFSVDFRNGIIRVTDELKAPSTFTVNITASNGIQDPVMTALTIRVVDEATGRSTTSAAFNEQVFYHFSVVENASAAPIGQLTYPLPKNGEKESGVVGNFEFFPLDQKAAPGWEHFKLARNGTLYTRRSLDRELMTSNLTLFVTVRENEHNRDTLRVSVTIVDVNDSPPMFGQQRYVGRVAENVPAGTKVQLAQHITASDADAWPHNITRYSLSGNGSRLFRIDPTVGEVTVVRSRSLDRERAPLYNLTVTASDGALTSDAQLTIIIDDVNDNAPSISGFVPAVNVVALERSADRMDFQDEGVIILCADGSCFTPIDLDESEPEQLPPGRILATYSRFRNHLLRILDEWIDEAERSVDQTPPDEQEILERAFREILYNSSILIQVPDDLPVNKSIGVFSVEDSDSLPVKSDELRFSLVAGTSNEDLFGVVPESGTLFLKKSLKKDKVYMIDVQVTDQNGLRSETGVAIQLTDVNDHRPSFGRTFYELLLPEGDYRDADFVAVEATDQDPGDNGRLIYSLLDSSRTPFRINQKTGLLVVNGSIDREQTEFYRLTVQASDDGFPPLKSRAEVVVYITDVNDNSPQFERPVGGTIDNGLQPLFSVSLTDGTPQGTAVIRVRATDADADVHTNGNVTYRLGSHQHLFAIDEATGSIFTLTTLDRARGDSEYNLLVVATDGGIPRLSTVGVVRITVAAACHPDPAARRQQSVTLDENVPTPIALVNLTNGENRSQELVQLSLLRIEPSLPVAQSLFRLDQTEPVLWLMEPLDRETLDTYSVHLRVQRSGRARNANNSGCTGIEEEELVLNIRVADINDNPPVFVHHNPLVVVVPSGAPVGHPVITLSATDVDDGNNAIIRYTMTPDAVTPFDESNPIDWVSAFALDSTSGSVSVASAVDRLAGHILSFHVKATDRSGSGLSATLHLSLHVLDRSHEVALVLATGTEELVNQSENISHVVSDISGMQVWIRSVMPHIDGDTVDGAMTDVVLYARNRTSQLLISSDDFSRLLNAKREEMERKLSHYNLREIRQINLNFKSLPSSPNARVDALEATLIAMGAAVLLGAVVTVVCIVLSRLKHKKRGRLVSSAPISMTMDYHLQSLRNMTASASYNDSSSQAALMSASSSGSSEIYVEVPADKGHPLYVSALPPAHQTQRCQQQVSATPICSSCQRLEAKRCKCLGKRPGKSLPEADSWLLRRKSATFCRIHSLPLSCRTLHPQSSARMQETEGTSTKLVRLTIPQRSTSMKIDTATSAVRFQDESKRHQPKPPRPKHRCPKHGLRRGSLPPSSSSLVQVHRRNQQLSSHPVGSSLESSRHPISFGNTTEMFEDSLDSSAPTSRK